MAMHKQDSNPVILGSGELYIGLIDDIEDLENLTIEEEEDLVNIGAIESGCTIDIANEYQEVKSANRGLISKFKIDSEVRLSTGIMTWNLKNISDFLTGSSYTDDGVSERKMVVGKDDNSPSVYIRFVHTKKDGTGQLIVNMYKGMFDGDLSFLFDSDNPVSINYEFQALTNDDNNYVEFIETYNQTEEPEKGSIIVYYKCDEDILDFKVLGRVFGTYTIDAIEIEDYELDDDASKEVTISDSNKIVAVEFKYKVSE